MVSEIITMGSATVDMIVTSPDAKFMEIDGKLTESKFLCLELGDKLLVDKIRYETGGGGTNTAVALSRLGRNTTPILKMGDDLHANFILEDLKKNKIDCSQVISEKGACGFSVILISPGHDRVILTHKGENDNLEKKHLNKSLIKDTPLMYQTSLTGNSFKTGAFAAKLSRKNGNTLMYNPSLYLTELGHKKIKPIITNTNVLIMNKEEARTLLGIPVNLKNDYINKILCDLLSFGPEIVIVTDGNNGAYAFDGSIKYFIPTVDVKIADATGVGDAFGAGFFDSYSTTNNIEKSLKWGLSVASCKLKKLGAKQGLPTKKQATEFMEKNIKIRVKKEKLN
ncbi:MAG: carbohydrate kinase family protein [Candidatus Diapherotrites archaeon]|nr:carbohydrate kinase family protein [Candidatus Diapherotrites archaeon]